MQVAQGVLNERQGASVFEPPDFYSQIQKFRGVISTSRVGGQDAAAIVAQSRPVPQTNQSNSGASSQESLLIRDERRVEELIAEEHPQNTQSYAVMIKDTVELTEEDLIIKPVESPVIPAADDTTVTAKVSEEVDTKDAVYAPETEPVNEVPPAPPPTAAIPATQERKSAPEVVMENSAPATTEGTAVVEEVRVKIPDYVYARYNKRILPGGLEKDPLAYTDTDVANIGFSEDSRLITRMMTLTTDGTVVQPPVAAVPPPPHSSSRFIVRFQSDYPHGLENCAQKIFTRGESFKDHLADGSSSIDKLNQICRVRSVRSLFMKRGQYDTQEAKLVQTRMIAESQKAFPQRKQRAVQNQAAIPDLTNTYVFEVPPDSDIKKICALYSADPHVVYAQPDHYVIPTVFPADPPNDPFYEDEQWALNNTGQTSGTPDADIDAPQAWPQNLGQGVIIAVNDSGIDYNHLDLAANIWVNPGEDTNGNGVVNGTNTCPTPNGDFNCVDNDGNGLVDDIRGWDFANSDNNPFDTDPLNEDFHGTMVAGYASAVANNGLGVLGIAPSAEIMIVKGFPDGGGLGFISDLANGIVYAAMEGADVINNSWGCITPCPSDPVVEAAVQTAHGLGAVIVMSAGNENDDVANYSPQNMSEVITVAATDHNDDRASFSNFGALVDVAAPGVEVISTYPFNQLAVLDGTSFSAPYASGVAALVISEYPAFTNEQIRHVLRDSADDVESIGFDILTGAGRINANEALTLVRVLPQWLPIGDKDANTGILLRFDVRAFDLRGDPLVLEAEIAGGAALATIGASFTDLGLGNGRFSWTPTPAQATLDPDIVFTVTDSPGGFTDTETITITVTLTGATCPNGITEAPEECDDNNLIDGDGCSASCTIETCGDGSLDFGEQCDDGGIIPGDGCNATCQFEFCGDGVNNNNGTEECDDGNFNNGDGCSVNCLDEICGNNRVDFGETCDDGNLISGDGCDATCQEEAVCGNGNQESTEECDDGNLTNGDGCNDDCILEFCGDDEVNDDGIEDCDDGNIISGDGCSATCRFEVCGNDIVDVAIGEECDDGNLVDGDGCSSDCILEVCGNNIVDPGEDCDDGNIISLDGCSSECRQEAVCPNFICESRLGETCVNCPMDCGYCRGLRPRD